MSVSKFTNDNCVYFVFHVFYYYVKDMDTHQVL